MEVANMFKHYYGMSMNPFDKEILTGHAYETADMKAMRGRLDYLREHPGIGLFTAGPGQGKTFCLRHLSDTLNPNITKFFYICLSTVTTTEFYRQMCRILGLETSYNKSALFHAIQEYFEDMSINKRIHCIVCLDEAQYLHADILRDLKILCNFHMDSKNCFSLILTGQPTLVNLLMRQPNEALRQRVTVNYRFEGLRASEALDYVHNRMELAGSTGRIFDDGAIMTAYDSCGGSIRKMNLIITKALMIGAEHEKNNIDTDMVLSAVNEIELC